MVNKFCQSCALPIDSEDHFGTEADGSRSKYYCSSCYDKGKFVNDMTIEQMLSQSLKIMAEKNGVNHRQAEEILKAFLPTMKRWRQY